MSLPASDGSMRADWGTRLARVLGLIAAIILLALMLLTAVDVVSRYIFNWPLRGAFELTELGLLVLIFAGLPLASRRGEHVTLDFIDKALGARGADIWRRVVEFIVGLVFAGLAWQVWIKAGKVTASGDVTDVLRLVVGPFVYLMAAMVAITALIHLARSVWPAPPVSHIPDLSADPAIKGPS